MLTRRVLPVLLVCALAGATGARAQTPAPAPAGQPAAAAGPQTVVLRLKNNTLLVGQVVRDEGDTIVFDAGTLGQLTLKKADIVATMDPATVMAAFQSAAAAAPPAPAGVGEFAAKGKVVWTRSVVFGGAITSAAYNQGILDQKIPALTGAALKLPGNQYTAQGQLTIMRATERGVAFVDGSLTYAKYDPFGKQADIPKISVGYNFKIANSTRLYGLTRYTYYSDFIRHVDYSNQALFGLGVHTINNPKVTLDLVPGVVALREKKQTRFDNQWLGGYGGLEQIVIHPNKFAQIEQRELFYQAFSDSSYYGLESYVGFKGMLSKWFGMQFGLSYIYDNVIAQQATPIPANTFYPGQPAFSVFANNKSQTFFTGGLLIRF